MSNYEQLKADIAAVVRANGIEAITGDRLQQVLTHMVDVLGNDYALAGVATPTTNPPTPDGNTAYIAGTSGTYTYFLDSNYNPLVVPSNCLTALLVYDASAEAWTAYPFGTIAQGTIGTNELADGAVTTPKIADSAVTSAKIGANAVTSAKINNGAVSEQKLATAVQNKINDAVTLSTGQTITGDKEFTQPIQALELYGDGDLSVHALDDLTLQSHNGDVEITADDDINLNGARVFVNTELNVEAGLNVGENVGGTYAINAQGKILTNGQEVATKAYTDTQLATKQDTIADLATIRAGAALGATALQDIPDGSVTLAKIAPSAIDAEPTANSGNLVTSGGVNDALKPIDEAINGQNESVVLNVHTLAVGRYISVPASGAGNQNANYNTAFYAITPGRKIVVHVPEMPNSACYTLAYATAPATGYWAATNVSVFADTIGVNTPTPFDYTINNAANHPYLAVCYAVNGGAPTVTQISAAAPVVVRTDATTYSESQQLQARNNINAASKDDIDSIKVLLIGSSHGMNTIGQFPILAYNSGVNVVCGNCYQGSLTLSQLAAYCDDNATLSGMWFKKFTNGEWEEIFSESATTHHLLECLISEKWDYISIQRSADEDETWTAGQSSSLKTILTYITAKCNWSPTIVFNSGFANGWDTNMAITSKKIWDTATQVREEYGIDIIPVAPILQIVREDPTLNTLGSYSTPPAMLTCDGQHLDQGIGMYVTGCICFEFFLRKKGKSVLECQYLTTAADMTPFWYSSGKFTPIEEQYAKKIRQYVSQFFAAPNGNEMSKAVAIVSQLADDYTSAAYESGNLWRSSGVGTAVWSSTTSYADNGRLSSFIPVKEGDVVLLTNTLTGTAPRVILADDDDLVTADYTTNFSHALLTIPSGTTRLYVNYSINSEFYCEVLGKMLSELAKALEQL